MRALVLNRYGDEDAAAVSDFPEPVPAEGEVLIEVHAASVNPVDIKIRAGQMKIIHPHKPPRVLGEDLAGKVVKLGPGASRFKVGDEVWACTGLARMGAFAEYAAVPESALSLKPKTLSFTDAASLPLVSLTVRRAFNIAGLKAGQRVFIRAGSGGVGVSGIQIAKALGAHVATTTSARNLDWVRQLGADEVIDYGEGRFEDRVKDFDLALETSKAKEFLRSFSVVRAGGYLVSVGDLPDARYAREIGKNALVRLAFAFVSRKATSAAQRTGVHYRFFIIEPDGEQLRALAELVDAGKLQPRVERVFPLAEAKEALAQLALGRTRGKIVIQVRG
jgi:alcohol dehydrogenase